MCIEVMLDVWNATLPAKYKGGVLLALANWADKDGLVVYDDPGVHTLMQRTGLSRATIFRQLGELERRKILRRTTVFHSGEICYRVERNVLIKLSTPPSQNETGGGLKMRRGGSQNETGGGLKMRPPIRKNIPEPEEPITPPGAPPFPRQAARILWTDAVQATRNGAHNGYYARLACTAWTPEGLAALKSIGGFPAICKTPPAKLSLLRRDFFDALGVAPR